MSEQRENVASSYLELEERLWKSGCEVHAVGCKSWFCDRCCEALGGKLRKRLMEVIESFTGVLMWTLTIDPQAIQDADEAYRYVRKKRCLSELMKGLRTKGAGLHSGRYFYVIEWHKSGRPHWHLLMDATHIEIGTVRHIWNRFRPKIAGPVQHAKRCQCTACGGGEKEATLRPGFGAVKFSKRAFADAKHAACYVCKYLTKPPRHGHPQWVWTFEGQIHRWGVSHGFWPKREKQKGRRAPSEVSQNARRRAMKRLDKLPKRYIDHPPTCFCDVCREGGKEMFEQPKRLTTIGERVGKCGTAAVVVRTVEKLVAGGEIVQGRQYLRQLDQSFDQLRAECGASSEERRLVVDGNTLRRWLKESDQPGRTEITAEDVEALDRIYLKAAREEATCQGHGKQAA